jgi:hypothetical protein
MFSDSLYCWPYIDHASINPYKWTFPLNTNLSAFHKVHDILCPNFKI